MGKKLNLSFLIVTFVTTIFIVTISGCSKSNSTNDNLILENVTSEIETEPTIPVSICGNEISETGEECDGNDIPSTTCQDKGYDEGIIGCTDECTLDLSLCIENKEDIETIQNIEPSTDACTDTDEGMDYSVKGVVTITNDDGSTKKYTDYCRHGSSEGFVFEYYCANDTLATQDYECPKGCNNNGACYP